MQIMVANLKDRQTQRDALHLRKQNKLTVSMWLPQNVTLHPSLTLCH